MDMLRNNPQVNADERPFSGPSAGYPVDIESQFIDPVKVVALLCRMHNVSMRELEKIVKSDSPDFNPHEEALAKEVNQKILEHDTSLLEMETLDTDHLAPSNPTIGEQLNCEPLDYDFELSDIEVDDDSNDSDYDLSFEELEDKRRHKKDIPFHCWLAAYCYWTRQEFSSSPVISHDFLVNCTNKRKEVSVQGKSNFKTFVGTGLQALREWVKRVERNGYGSARQVNERVHQLFVERRQQHGIVNSRMLRLWGLQAKNEINPRMKFSASASWAAQWKKKYNVVSRAITHVVGKDYYRNLNELNQKATNFVELVKQTILQKNYQPSEIINMDQSRFDKEMHCHRTLNQKEAKHIFVKYGSKTSKSHSYMIMPFIAADGTVSQVLYLKAQESATGEFPQHRNIPIIPDNIKAFAGTSAIMNGNDLEVFLEIMFQELTQRGLKRCLLLADSWASNKNKDLLEQICARFPMLEVERLVIPEGCTGLIQPLDVFYFRQYKDFVYTLADSLKVGDQMWKRNNYFKLQSFIHYQFCAPMFTHMIQYAFSKCGYLQQRPPSFQTPVEYCLALGKSANCDHPNCDRKIINCVRCAYCTKIFCLKHCILDILHTKDVCSTY